MRRECPERLDFALHSPVELSGAARPNRFPRISDVVNLNG